MEDLHDKMRRVSPHFAKRLLSHVAGLGELQMDIDGTRLAEIVFSEEKLQDFLRSIVVGPEKRVKIFNMIRSLGPVLLRLQVPTPVPPYVPKIGSARLQEALSKSVSYRRRHIQAAQAQQEEESSEAPPMSYRWYNSIEQAAERSALKNKSPHNEVLMRYTEAMKREEMMKQKWLMQKSAAEQEKREAVRLQCEEEKHKKWASARVRREEVLRAQHRLERENLVSELIDERKRRARREAKTGSPMETTSKIIVPARCLTPVVVGNPWCPDDWSHTTSPFAQSSSTPDYWK